MHNEQIFTPEHVVYTMFEELEYKDDKVRKKHVIDNSCGNGAILKLIVRKYITTCILCGLSKEETVSELETYIHGIEIDENLYNQTIKKLDNIAKEYSLGNVKWDIVCGDAMYIHTYDNKMDYVIGNPPYCNIHDIPEEKRDYVKQYKFANGGMTDMYLVFFEIGINMLNENGKLAYITPNSWLTSTAGTNFRKYLKDSKTLIEIYQYGHYKVFEKANTYTCITLLSKTSKTNNVFICQRYIENPDILVQTTTIKVSMENLDECMIDGKIYLTDQNTLNTLKKINEVTNKIKKNKNRIRVKNGFATLNDKLFIIDEYHNKRNANILRVCKASNREKHYFFYPYDENGKPMKLSEIDSELVNFMKKKAIELKVDINKPNWYLYGRTQALNDVKYDKLSINNLIRHNDDVKIQFLGSDNKKQFGVYSGYYIPIYNKDIENKVMSIMTNGFSKDFVEYIKAVGKYKNGGYYTFSSKELEMWLNYYIFSKNLKLFEN